MKKTTLGLAALAVLVGVSLPAVSYAYRGDPSVKGPNCTPERHEAMEKAFEDRDYEAWKNLMQGRGRVSQTINESNFARFAEARDLAKQGKIDEARQIRTELGLGLRDGSGQGRHGMGR